MPCGRSTGTSIYRVIYPVHKTFVYPARFSVWSIVSVLLLEDKVRRDLTLRTQAAQLIVLSVPVFKDKFASTNRLSSAPVLSVSFSNLGISFDCVEGTVIFNFVCEASLDTECLKSRLLQIQVLLWRGSRQNKTLALPGHYNHMLEKTLGWQLGTKLVQANVSILPPLIILFFSLLWC